MFSKNSDLVTRNRVREQRTNSGLTQEELAKKIDVSRQTVIAIEKNDYTPSVLLALRIAKALEKNVEEIFWYEKK